MISTLSILLAELSFHIKWHMKCYIKHVGDGSRRSEEIVKISDYTFECDHCPYYYHGIENDVFVACDDIFSSVVLFVLLLFFSRHVIP